MIGIIVLGHPFSEDFLMNLHARDLILAHRAKRAGASYSLRIIMEARAAGLPISLAFAVVDEESTFRNIFGCDKGGPFCHDNVTKERVQHLIHIVEMGGTSQGVGLSQLTFIGYIKQAEALGGAHIPKHQLQVGFRAIAHMIAVFGERGGLAAYNAGHPDNPFGKKYAARVENRKIKWHKALMSKKQRCEVELTTKDEEK
jgi:hypothetical protein